MEKFWEEVKTENKSFAFLFGNGINEYIGTRKSWDSLIKDNIKDDKKLKDAYEDEAVTALECINLKSLEKDIDFSALNKSFKKNSVCRILDFAIKNKAQILTTNFDHNIKRYIEQKTKKEYKLCSKIGKTKEQINNSNAAYKWNKFWGTSDIKADEAIDNKESRVWHVHGMITEDNKYNSICFSFSKYICAVTKYKKFNHPDVENWGGENTWLKIFFESPLIVAGLGLSSQELFLRYLFLERYRYHKRTGKILPSYYLKSDEDDNKENGAAFLSYLGFKVVTFKKYKEVFNSDLWK